LSVGGLRESHWEHLFEGMREALFFVVGFFGPFGNKLRENLKINMLEDKLISNRIKWYVPF
jgi:hypothetical protein